MIAIAAMTPSRVIGRGSEIPWRIPGEQKWFKEATLGHPILMGSRTFESIGRRLPGRQNLVVSRGRSWPGVEMIRDLAEFDPDRYSPEVFVIGGAEIYAQLIDGCRELLITRVKHEYNGDAYFPEFESKFRLIEQIRETPDYMIERWSHKSHESHKACRAAGLAEADPFERAGCARTAEPLNRSRTANRKPPTLNPES
jgi:dihydrofolate reductase